VLGLCLARSRALRHKPITSTKQVNGSLLGTVPDSFKKLKLDKLLKPFSNDFNRIKKKGIDRSINALFNWRRLPYVCKIKHLGADSSPIKHKEMG